MDSLTQIILGAAYLETVSGKKIGDKVLFFEIRMYFINGYEIETRMVLNTFLCYLYRVSYRFYTFKSMNYVFYRSRIIKGENR